MWVFGGNFIKSRTRRGVFSRFIGGGGYMTGRGDKEVIMGSVAILKVQYA